jgi:hypothetical protein
MEMKTKRLVAAAAGILLAVGLTACGGGSSGGTTAPTAAPTPPTKAAVTFNVDPDPVTSEYQGGGWWRFKVNLEFYDTAGVGFTVNTVRTTVSEPLAGQILLDYDYAVASHVDPRGRTVLQFTSPPYWTLVGGAANIKFVANVTDDRGNGLTISNEARILHRSTERISVED